MSQIPQSCAELGLFFSKIQDGARSHLVSPKMIILVTLSTTCCHSIPEYQIWWEYAHPWRRNGTFMKSKLAAAAILNFGYVTFLVAWSNLWCYFVRTYKIWAKFLNAEQSYGYFSKIQDGGRRHIVFAKMILLVTLSTTGCHSAPAYLIWWSSHPRRRNGQHGYEIQNCGRRHLYFWLDGIFGQVFRFMVVFCTYAQNLNQIPRSWAKLWLFFAKFKMADVRHFGIVMTSFKTILVEYFVMSWVC